MNPMTTQLKCAECNEMFEISNEIADAMTRWRDASGEPIICGECACTIEEIHDPEIQERSNRCQRED